MRVGHPSPTLGLVPCCCWEMGREDSRKARLRACDHKRPMCTKRGGCRVSVTICLRRDTAKLTCTLKACVDDILYSRWMVTTEERKKGKRKQVDENDDGKT